VGKTEVHEIQINEQTLYLSLWLLHLLRWCNCTAQNRISITLSSACPMKTY